MNRRGWYIPMLIVALNVLAVVVRWSSLPELLPAHFDLQGNASGEISRNVLLLYPLINAIFCLIAYLITKQTTKMDYREMMQHAPKECQPTVIDTNKDYQEALKQVAKANNKEAEELTSKEKEQAMRSIGLCDLDFQTP